MLHHRRREMFMWSYGGRGPAFLWLWSGSCRVPPPVRHQQQQRPTPQTHCFTLASSRRGLDTGPVLSVSSSGTCCAPYSLSWDCRLHRSGTSWVMASFLVWGSEKVMLHSNPVDADTQVQLRPTEFTCNTKRFPVGVSEALLWNNSRMCCSRSAEDHGNLVRVRPRFK